MSTAKLAMWGLMVAAGVFAAILEYLQSAERKGPKLPKARRYRGR